MNCIANYFQDVGRMIVKVLKAEGLASAGFYFYLIFIYFKQNLKNQNKIDF